MRPGLTRGIMTALAIYVAAALVASIVWHFL